MWRQKNILTALGALLIVNASSVPHSFLEDAPDATTSHIAARSEYKIAPPQGVSHLERFTTTYLTQDTLRNRVRGGEILIVALPAELRSGFVERYSIVRAPALSWLVDKSFMWRTLPADSGTHEVLFHAVLDSETPDTLVISIFVE